MIGWLGSIFLAMCGFPQAIQSVRTGHSQGLNTVFLLLWTVGEILTVMAVRTDAPLHYLLFNYCTNLIFLIVIWKYKIYPRSKNGPR